jgi:hypothetical protein
MLALMVSVALVMSLVASSMSWLAVREDRARRLKAAEGEAIEAIRRLGGSVGQDFDLDVLPWDTFGGTVISVHGEGPGNWLLTDEGLGELKAHLEGMPRLHYVDLQHTQVTDAGLEHLKGLSQLQTLYLRGTQVTDAGVRRLQEALPKCEIQR